MPPISLFGALRSTGRQAARTERVLAVGRGFLTVTALIAIYLDPTEPARLREVTYGVLLGYAVYSLAVLAYVNSTARLTTKHGQVLHGLDILWTSALTFVSEGPVSPFFLFFLFVVLAAAYRSLPEIARGCSVRCCREMCVCHDRAQVVQQRAARVARSQVSVHDRTLVCAQLVVEIIRQAINDVIAHGVRSALARTGNRRWAI